MMISRSKWRPLKRSAMLSIPVRFLKRRVSANMPGFCRSHQNRDKLFTFTRFPQSQWKSIRTTNAIERMHEEFKRRIKTQTVLPCAETAAMLFWALMASGQIIMRKVDGWQSLAEKPDNQIIDLAA